MKKKDISEREIFSHIKQSLERYEEAYIPGSWENFLHKGKTRKRRLLYRIVSGIAACLLVGYVGSNLINFENRDQLTSTAEQTTATLQNIPDDQIKSAKDTRPLTATTESGSKQFKSAKSESKIQSILKEKFVAKVENGTTEQTIVSIPTVDSTNKIAAIATNIERQTNISKTDSIIPGSPDSAKGKSNKVFLNAPPSNKDQNLASVSKKRVRFGLNFSPGLSTAQASSSFNYTGGISADIPLSSKFQLSTGLQVENQSMARKFQSIASSSTAPQNETRTKLINLDLPVNITWKFASEKSHAYYVSAGLSSLVYLRQENKNTTYSQTLVPVSSIVAGNEIKTYNVVDKISVSQDQVAPPQTFDFAGRINMIVGFEKKLSDKIFIHFEPYAKIPVSGLAPGELNHTTTGINFKISF
jgi:hypothetical protein